MREKPDYGRFFLSKIRYLSYLFHIERHHVTICLKSGLILDTLLCADVFPQPVVGLLCMDQYNTLLTSSPKANTVWLSYEAKDAPCHYFFGFMISLALFKVTLVSKSAATTAKSVKFSKLNR